MHEISARNAFTERQIRCVLLKTRACSVFVTGRASFHRKARFGSRTVELRVQGPPPYQVGTFEVAPHIKWVCLQTGRFRPIFCTVRFPDKRSWIFFYHIEPLYLSLVLSRPVVSAPILGRAGARRRFCRGSFDESRAHRARRWIRVFSFCQTSVCIRFPHLTLPMRRRIKPAFSAPRPRPPKSRPQLSGVVQQ